MSRPNIGTVKGKLRLKRGKGGTTLKLDVVAAVIRRGDRYLLCQRPSDKRHGGLWEFPGGKVMEGESQFDAIRRELDEELGVKAKPRLTIPGEVPVPGDIAMSLHFVETEIQGEPMMLEHQDMGWFTVDEMHGVELAPADAQFVAMYFDQE